MSVKIVLDPGHGGRDPGAVGYGLREKDLTLDIACKARDALAAYDVDVYMTRNADVDMELTERAALANRLAADIFVSIHCNAGGGTGFESYIYPGASDRTQALQGAIHEHLGHFYDSYGLTDRGRKSANFAVLRLTQMPAILLENLFIDTAGDAGKLADPAFRQQIAEAITAGLVEALGLRRATDPVTDAIQTLCRAGVIASPDYWVRNARPGRIVDGEYAGMLLQNMAKKLGGF